MNIIVLLAPISLALGGAAVAAFLWSLKGGQYEDMRGAAERLLLDDADEAPDPTAAPNTRGRQTAVSINRPHAT